MPFNGSGIFTRVMDWTNDAAAAIKIRADRHDQNDDDLAAGLSNAICRDGQSQVTQDIPFNGKKITSLAAPTNPTDAATKAYADSIRNFSSGTTLTGTSTGSSPNFVSTAFIGFTEADMAIVGRKDDTGPDPDVIKRIAFNDKVDGTGNDLFVINEDGSVTSRAADGTQKKFTPVTAQTRNRIVNGAMQHSQQNYDSASAASALHGGYYCADQTMARWSVSPGTMAAGRHASIKSPDDGRTVVLTTSTIKASLAATDHALITQLIEGSRIADLQWGTASARPIVIRFQVRGTYTGKFSFRVCNNAVDRSYVSQFDIASADTWTLIEAVIPGDTSGTWLTDAGVGLRFEIAIGVGSSYVGTAGAWQAGNIFAGPGQTNGVATAGSFLVSDVGLYLDPDNTGIPPKWEMPDYAEELIACRRYFFATDDTYTGFWSGTQTAGVAAYTPVRFLTQMRIAPAVTEVNGNQSNFPAGSTFNTSPGGLYAGRTAIATGAGFYHFGFHANARM